jgi:CDP-4-dehydro-6-deoxyglucose reductase
MPDPKFTKPWHGVPRESIEWHPTVNEDACIGCGTCVTGCSRMVYRYDYDRKKPVVVDPLNCMVGCTTCANTCPTHAISFPPLATVFALEGQPKVRHAVEDDLLARHEQLAWHDAIPHPDRVVSLRVATIARPGPNTLILTLTPRTPADALCQFMPGQYLEILPLEGGWLARAYSIGNALRDDGSVELQIRRVAKGRFSEWLFDRLCEADVVQARGPFGQFTLRSAPGTPLVFVAGGTGFAPIKAMIEQQLSLDPTWDLRLFWGVGVREDLYELDEIAAWARRGPRLVATIAVDHGSLPEDLPAGIEAVSGNAAQAITIKALSLAGYDAYVAGPPAMIPSVVEALTRQGVDLERIRVDSFGL